MRTIIELPTGQLEALDALCRAENISRAEAIRRAVAAHVRQARAHTPDPAYGIWRGRSIDGLAYTRTIRDEWDRGRASTVPAPRRTRAGRRK